MVDAAFVGTVDKDQTTLQQEHKEVFMNANKAIMEKKVCKLLKLAC